MDAFLYNAMTINAPIGLTIPFLVAAMVHPGGSWVAATIVAAIVCATEGLVYALLVATMPRSGGEYYFQSRIFSRGIGSVVCFAALVLGGMIWVAVEGWFAAYLAVGPLFVVMSSLTNSETLLDMGAWFQSSWGVLLLSIAVIAWSALANTLGLRVYARLQRAFWAVAVAAFIAVLLVLVTSNDLSQLPVYRAATAHAATLGFPGAHTQGWLLQTLLIVPLTSFTLVYAAWSTQQAGEIKRASEPRVQFMVILGAMLTTALASALLGALVVDRFGSTTLGAAAFLFLRFPESMPLPVNPLFWFVSTASGAGKIFAGVLAILFNSLFWMYAPNATLAASRVMLAMSTDRVLPRWVGVLHFRTKAPVNAIASFSLLCLVPSVVFAFSNQWSLPLATVAIVNSVAFALTCAAGAAFPYVQREHYRESIAARYEVLGMPLITVCGAAFAASSAFLVFLDWLTWKQVVEPFLGVAHGVMVLAGLSLALYAGSLVAYIGFSAWRRSHESVELELWYTDAPEAN
ncbi:MAG: amino acid permease [Thermoleophilia bacterium]